jgi:hypothetical protein
MREGKIRDRGDTTAGRPSFSHYLPGGSIRTAVRLFAAVSTEKWEAALAEGRKRNEVGLIPIQEALLGTLPPEQPRNPQSNRVLTEMIGQLEGVVAGLAMANPLDVSPETAAEFELHAKANLREITRFIKELSLAHK